MVGLGSIGTRRARLLASFPQTTELVVFDTDPARTRDFLYNLDVPLTTEGQALVPLGSIEDVLEQRPDAVLICTPPKTHVPIAMQCLEAGIRGVFIEKPLSVSMDGIAELQQAARNAVVMIACNMRWAYQQLAVSEAHLSQRVRMISSAPLASWGGDIEQYRYNGIALESAIHEIDLAASWLGRIVDADVHAWDEDHLSLTLHHEFGGTARIFADWSAEAPVCREVVFTRSRIPADTADQMYIKEMQHFLGCVENNKQPCNTIADATHVLSWALRAKDAHERA